MINPPPAVSRSARSSTPARPALGSRPTTRTFASLAPYPTHASYGSFTTFTDPDGNGWLLQEITPRLPGRMGAAETAFASTRGPSRCAAARGGPYGGHEKRIGQADEKWADRYAAYMVAVQAGKELPT
jgi:hypothetical protein